MYICSVNSKHFHLKILLLYMCVKQSTLRKAKDNIRFITHPMFLVIILLTSGNSFIAGFFVQMAKSRIGKCVVFIML